VKPAIASINEVLDRFLAHAGGIGEREAVVELYRCTSTGTATSS